jgi:hypothetical protein
MDHIEIDMVEPQLPQTGVEGAVERIRRKLIMPDLRGDEELVPVHAGRRDGRAYGGFVVLHRGGVDMSVAEPNRTLDDRLGVGSRHPEGAEAEAPAYLEKHGEPRSPHDLVHHEALLFRDPQTGLPFPWEFQRGGEVKEVKVSSRLVNG